MILHTINKAPNEGCNVLQSCLRLAKKDCGIILIEDGVYAALENSITKPLMTDEAFKSVHFYALEADLKARGLLASNKLYKLINIISYTEFVELSLQYSSVQAWT